MLHFAFIWKTRQKKSQSSDFLYLLYSFFCFVKIWFSSSTSFCIEFYVIAKLNDNGVIHANYQQSHHRAPLVVVYRQPAFLHASRLFSSDLFSMGDICRVANKYICGTIAGDGLPFAVLFNNNTSIDFYKYDVEVKVF